MAETKQISATIDLHLANEIKTMADQEKRTFSNMVELLLMTGKNNWIRKPKKEKTK